MTDSIKPHWHTRFLALAAHIATWSRDPSKKVGVVVVRPDKTVASMGFNGFPRGVHDTPERYDDRDTKLDIVVHAELNALLHAREPLHGYSLYIWPYHPCARCAAAIIQSGIVQIYTIGWKDTTRWADTIRTAQQMFDEAGVTVTVLDETITLPDLFIEE